MITTFRLPSVWYNPNNAFNTDLATVLEGETIVLVHNIIPSFTYIKNVYNMICQPL